MILFIGLINICMARFKEYKKKFSGFHHIEKEVNDAIARSGNWLYEDPFSNESNQIMIQCTDHEKEDWFTGTGTAPYNNSTKWSQQFNCIQPSLRGTALEDYIYWLELPVYRTRIMVMRPKTAYSIHSDSSPRLHLPVTTNKHAYFIFKDPAELIHMPANGDSYAVDTRETHSFMNGGDEIRIHIVSAIDNETWEKL
jgi:hypothetical protein